MCAYIKNEINSELEKTREILLNLSSKKIQEHVEYAFAWAAFVWASYQLLEKIQFNHLIFLSYLFIFFSVIFFIFLFGRILYWSVFNTYIVTHSPVKLTYEGSLLKPNYIWALQISVTDRIHGTKDYKDMKRTWKCKFANLFSRSISAFAWAGTFSSIIILSFILFFDLSSLHSIIINKTTIITAIIFWCLGILTHKYSTKNSNK